ncbi:hypothetical protein FCR2A7T_27440 [Flavobacterium cauense R2A-7]|nr:hypothetical protein FCR2A7T_27440 [Flavobacterium cauense R2A-7]
MAGLGDFLEWFFWNGLVLALLSYLIAIFFKTFRYICKHQ